LNKLYSTLVTRFKEPGWEVWVKHEVPFSKRAEEQNAQVRNCSVYLV
jgi:hypothetical protein